MICRHGNAQQSPAGLSCSAAEPPSEAGVCLRGRLIEVDGKLSCISSSPAAVGPECETDDDCESGHACVLNQLDPTRVDGVERSPGRCSPSCSDALCAPGEECRDEGNPPCDGCLPAQTCQPVVCGRVVRCAERGGVPMYCNAKRQTCFTSDGQCGLLGGESYTCPDRSPYLPPNVKVVCDRPNDQPSGTCVFKFESNVSDTLLEDVERDIEILSPRSGTSLASASDLKIDVTGSAAPAFVLLLGPSTALQKSKPKDADRLKSLDDLFDKAVWAAAVPRAAAKSRRHIAWSEGHAVKDGRWELEPGQPPAGIYALFALAMEGDEVVAISSDFPQLQIGSEAASGFAVEDQPCSSPADCYSPTSVLACIDVTCRRLCLSDADCEQNPAGEDAPPGYCHQNLDADFRYCRFDSA